jgi:hypothetical protein
VQQFQVHHCRHAQIHSSTWLYKGMDNFITENLIRSILILSSHLRLSHPSGLFPFCFPTKNAVCTPLPYVLYGYSSHPPTLVHSYIWRRIQVMKNNNGRRVYIMKIFINSWEKEAKLSLCLTDQTLRHKGVCGSGCMHPRFLDLGTSLTRMVSFTPGPLYPRGKSPRYPLQRRLGRPKNWPGQRGESSCHYWDSNSEPYAVQPVASRYIDWAIMAPHFSSVPLLLSFS